MGFVLNPYRYGSAVASSLQNIVAHWDASDYVSGTTLTDLTGNGHTLNLANWGSSSINSVTALKRSTSTTLSRLYTSTHPLSTSPFGVMIVYQATGADDVIFDTGTGTRPHFHSAGVSNFTLYGTGNLSTGVARDSSPHVWYVEFNGSSTQVWLDGVDLGVFSPGSSNPNGSSFTIGNVVGGGVGIGITSRFGEAYVCTGTQDDADISGVMSTLMTKWGIS